MILGLLQARMSSSRLPGKVMMPILERPMLSLQIERLRRARRLDELVVATSTELSDDPLAALCEREGVACFRGPLDDVLGRFYQAAESYGADQIVRLTGDCPLADPAVVDSVIEFFVGQNVDYASNTLNPTWPDGLDVEVLTRNALEIAYREATEPYEREHVTPFLWGHPERFGLANLEGPRNLSHHRWTVDEPEDFDLVARIFQMLYPRDHAFTTEEVLALLERNPELANVNQHLKRANPNFIPAGVE